MDSQNRYQTEKLGKDEKKKKADLERRTGVPDPPVPNRAYTEMSYHSPFQASKSNLDENVLRQYADRYKNRMNDSKHREEKE